MIPPGTLDSSDTRPTAAISYRILQPPPWLKKQFAIHVLWRIQKQMVIVLVFHQKIFLKNSTSIPESLYVKKRLRYRCFPVNFVEFFRKAFLLNTAGRQLLKNTNLHILKKTALSLPKIVFSQITSTKIPNREISHLFLVFLLLTLNKKMLAGNVLNCFVKCPLKVKQMN